MTKMSSCPGNTTESRCGAYDLPIEVVFFDHHRVDRFRVSESQEAEASGAACGTVAHYGALLYLAELREVLLQ